MRELLSIAGVPVIVNPDGSAEWTAGMMIDVDGSPRAYHPVSNRGQDYLGNANYPDGHWQDILASDGKQPARQKDGDTAPGYFVSMTTYQHKGFEERDPRKYVDAEAVPYVVVPPQVRMQLPGIVMGCRATITHKGKTIEAVVADVGPRLKIGEASMRAAEMLGINPSPRTGGRASKDVTYRIYPDVPAVVNGVTYQLQRA